ncbi:MAG: 4Fe-4S dicluster domain-containing protein [Bryobacteraceae bacterium]|nr:4Fe-4S dicluster domain-containing protein [Bryobacteraceae bacterium]
MPTRSASAAALSVSALAELISTLQARGYQVIGPAVRDGTIVYSPIERLEDLPAGFSMEQEAGACRLVKRNDGAVFGYAAGPRSLKSFFHPAEIKLISAERDNGTFRIVSDAPSPPRTAFIGVRACEIAAVRIQDRVLLEDRYKDTFYETRRAHAFIVAVNCTAPADTCFCASTNTGPRAREGFDIALTEIVDDGRHVFLAEAGSAAGKELLRELPKAEPAAELRKAAEKALQDAAGSMKRRLDTDGLAQLLYDNFDHPHWDDLASRCLCCANCTLVCPTCFCVAVDEASDVDGRSAERWRRWDSCFTQSFSYIHGGSVRHSPKSRYRQWLTHKFASWSDQFGTLGCVGCGRCIAWCPVGIDVTRELAAFRTSPAAVNSQGGSHD